jgi:hypothetical protein
MIKDNGRSTHFFGVKTASSRGKDGVEKYAENADKGREGAKVGDFMRTSFVHHSFLRYPCFCLCAYRHSYLTVLCLQHFYAILQ